MTVALEMVVAPVMSVVPEREVVAALDRKPLTYRLEIVLELPSALKLLATLAVPFTSSV